MAIWCALARTATGIVDVGANVGIYSLAAAKLRPDLTVHAFEPNPYAYARLRIHKHVNELPNLAEHPYALGSEDAFLKLKWVVKPGGNIASGAGLGSLPAGFMTESTLARVISLDGKGLAGLLGDKPLVKVDVEGAEVKVLSGMKEVLGKNLDLIVEAIFPRSGQELTEFLGLFGYAIYAISEAGRAIVRQDRVVSWLERPGSPDLNHLFTMRPPAELARVLPKDIRVEAAS
jgi:FkbM family methyltransferase